MTLARTLHYGASQVHVSEHFLTPPGYERRAFAETLVGTFVCVLLVERDANYDGHTEISDFRQEAPISAALRCPNRDLQG